jgi:hypothetical protein
MERRAQGIQIKTLQAKNIHSLHCHMAERGHTFNMLAKSPSCPSGADWGLAHTTTLGPAGRPTGTKNGQVPTLPPIPLPTPQERRGAERSGAGCPGRKNGQVPTLPPIPPPTPQERRGAERSGADCPGTSPTAAARFRPISHIPHQGTGAVRSGAERRPRDGNYEGPVTSTSPPKERGGAERRGAETSGTQRETTTFAQEDVEEISKFRRPRGSPGDVASSRRSSQLSLLTLVQLSS